MTRTRSFSVIAVMALAIAVTGCSSSDKSSDTTTTAKSGGVTVTTAPAGTPVAVEVGDTKGVDGPMTLTATPNTVPAGAVTFTVKNTGTIEHEVIVLKTDTPYDQIAVDSAGDPPAKVTGSTVADKVSEDAKVGETGENIPAGQTKTFTIDKMEAGKYALVCNIAKHYGMGMRAPFTVS
jgi:uncharacterized cupredoxin-like copper-binding protein